MPLPEPPKEDKYFYPRPPRGGRRGRLRHVAEGWVISTHALREEGDNRSAFPVSSKLYFYPRPPRGGRPKLG